MFSYVPICSDVPVFFVCSIFSRLIRCFCRKMSPDRHEMTEIGPTSPENGRNRHFMFRYVPKRRNVPVCSDKMLCSVHVPKNVRNTCGTYCAKMELTRTHTKTNRTCKEHEKNTGCEGTRRVLFMFLWEEQVVSAGEHVVFLVCFDMF